MREIQSQNLDLHCAWARGLWAVGSPDLSDAGIFYGLAAEQRHDAAPQLESVGSYF